jgi:copper chaperone CopZ
MESTTERTRLVAPGIWCGRRERAVARALSPLAGVRRVGASAPTKRVAVDFDSGVASRDENLETLAATEYPVAP